MLKKHLVSLVLSLGFILGIHEGYVALWRCGEAEPLQVFPYRAQMLPTADQKALHEGIIIQDGTELAEILEDYLS